MTITQAFCKFDKNLQKWFISMQNLKKETDCCAVISKKHRESYYDDMKKLPNTENKPSSLFIELINKEDYYLGRTIDRIESQLSDLKKLQEFTNEKREAVKDFCKKVKFTPDVESACLSHLDERKVQRERRKDLKKFIKKVTSELDAEFDSFLQSCREHNAQQKDESELLRAYRVDQLEKCKDKLKLCE